MKNERFHVLPQDYRKYETRSIDKALDRGTITPEDANLIREFAAETTITNNLSPVRRYKLVSNLLTSCRFLPSVKDMTLGAVYDGLDALRNGKKENGDQYAQNTKADLIRFSKRYLLWLSENGHIEIPRDKLKKIKQPAYNHLTKNEDDILTEEEIRRIIDAARTTRYKAIIGVMYEGGLRSSEVASLQWQDVTFYKWGARIRTDGKTGKPRSIPIISFRDYLAAWKAEYPKEATGENFVFLNMHGKPLQYRGVVKSIQKFAKAAGIETKVTLHTFRHSRVTHALRGGMQETICKKVFWGNETTSMIATYSHLVDDDTDRAFAKLAGVELPDDEPLSEALMPIQCPRCMHVNPPGGQYCGKCGLPLTEEAQHTYESVIAEVEERMTLPGGPEVIFEAMARMRDKQ